MCLLVVKQAGVDLPSNIKEICENANIMNPHGFGFSIPNGRYRTINDDVDKWLSLFEKHIKKNTPAILHWRFATSGEKTKHNCHPFVILDGTQFAHNGVCSDVFKPTEFMSDTAVLGYVSPTYEKLVENCQRVVGPGNKFAILSSKEEIDILGEKYGETIDGIWYSNDSWKPFTYAEDDFYETEFNDIYRTNNALMHYGTQFSTDYVQLQCDLDALIQKYGYDAVEQAYHLSRVV